MTQILVFGGAGYIGSHTCKRLYEAGFTPVTFDNLSEGHAEFVRWGPLIRGDIAAPDQIRAAIERVRPAAAIHFAASAYVGESVADPGKYYANNVAGSLNVAQALRVAGNIPLIFSSSCATYGAPDVGRISEDVPQAPINPYGRSKLMGEHILSDFSGAYGLRSVCLRYFNAAGADAAGELGEAHREETHLIPRAILAGLGRVQDFCIFGQDYDTPDGSAVRDYIHVTDLAEGHLAACRYLLDGGATDAFNLGFGRGYSVFEVVSSVCEHLGVPVPYSVRPRREGDPATLVADPSKARAILGFRARHSSLENLVKTAVAWHRKTERSAMPREGLCA